MSDVTTARLRLSRWDPARHTPALEAINASPDAVRYLNDGVPYTPRRARRQSARFAAHWERYGFGLWAASLVRRPASVDRLRRPRSIRCGSRRSRDAGRGRLAPASRRPGATGTRPRAAAPRWRAPGRSCGLERVISVIDPANAPSIAVAERLGDDARGARRAPAAPGLAGHLRRGAAGERRRVERTSGMVSWNDQRGGRCRPPLRTCAVCVRYFAVTTLRVAVTALAPALRLRDGDAVLTRCERRGGRPLGRLRRRADRLAGPRATHTGDGDSHRRRAQADAGPGHGETALDDAGRRDRRRGARGRGPRWSPGAAARGRHRRRPPCWRGSAARRCAPALGRRRRGRRHRRRDVGELVGVDRRAARGLLEAHVGELDRAGGRHAGAAELELELADVGEVDALGGEVAQRDADLVEHLVDARASSSPSSGAAPCRSAGRRRRPNRPCRSCRSARS